jgi:hypothetical protein
MKRSSLTTSTNAVGYLTNPAYCFVSKLTKKHNLRLKFFFFCRVNDGIFILVLVCVRDTVATGFVKNKMKKQTKRKMNKGNKSNERRGL